MIITIMIKPEQIENLLEFTIIFTSSLNIRHESPDYYREKYDMYIGFQMKHSNKKSDTYKEWSKIWGEDEDVNSIINYFVEIMEIYSEEYRGTDHEYDKAWIIKIHPEEILKSFAKHIGDIEKINSERRTFMHPNLTTNLYDKWIEKNLRYFKFLRILKNVKR